MDRSNLQNKDDNKFIALVSNKRTIWYTITTQNGHQNAVDLE